MNKKQNDPTRKHNQIEIQATQNLIHPGYILSSQNQQKTLMNVTWRPRLVHPGNNQTSRTLPFHARTLPSNLFQDRKCRLLTNAEWTSSQRMIMLTILSTSRSAKLLRPSHSEDIHSSLVDAPRLLLVVAQHSQSTGSPQRRDLASFVRPIWGGRENPNFSTPCISSHQSLPLAGCFPFWWTTRTGSTFLFWAIT